MMIGVNCTRAELLNKSNDLELILRMLQDTKLRNY